MMKEIKALQHHPTSRSCPHKQAGTFRTPFEMDFICNNISIINLNINLSITTFKKFIYEIGKNILEN